MNRKGLFIQMNKKRLAIILSSVILFSCNSKTPSSSMEANTSNDVSINSIQSDSVTSESSTSKTSSSAFTSDSSSNSIEEHLALSESDFLSCLEEAKVKDEDYSSVSILNYTFKKNSYSRSKYKMTAYTNNITLHEGEVRANNNKDISNFIEQRVYQDNTYYAIRKFDSTFLNRATKSTLSLEKANVFLNINQSETAALVISTLKTGYKLNYQGYITSDNTKCVSYMYVDDFVDNSGYVLCALIQVELTSDNHLSDFFYSEAYYDSYYVEDGIASLRKHGAHPVGDGYSYEMDTFVQESRKEYQGELVFSLKDNFISSMSFSNEEVSISLSNIIPDEYNRKSIKLLDYLSCSPAISSSGKGCPVNNLSFTSSNQAVGTIGDSYYLDITSVGETIITAKDAGNNISSSNSMKVIITE